MGWRSSVKLARCWHGTMMGWWDLDVTPHERLLVTGFPAPLGCCDSWTYMSDVSGCLRDGSHEMLSVLVDDSET